MKSLQEGGRRELDALRKRAQRSYGMGRISQEYYELLKTRIDSLDSLLIEIPEQHPERREF